MTVMKKNLDYSIEYIRLFFFQELSTRSSYDTPSNNQPKIRVQLKYDNGKLFVMVRYANNLVSETTFDLFI